MGEDNLRREVAIVMPGSARLNSIACITAASVPALLTLAGSAASGPLTTTIGAVASALSGSGASLALVAALTTTLPAGRPGGRHIGAALFTAALIHSLLLGLFSVLPALAIALTGLLPLVFWWTARTASAVPATSCRPSRSLSVFWPASVIILASSRLLTWITADSLACLTPSTTIAGSITPILAYGLMAVIAGFVIGLDSDIENVVIIGQIIAVVAFLLLAPGATQRSPLFTAGATATAQALIDQFLWMSLIVVAATSGRNPGRHSVAGLAVNAGIFGLLSLSAAHPGQAYGTIALSALTGSLLLIGSITAMFLRRSRAGPGVADPPHAHTQPREQEVMQFLLTGPDGSGVEQALRISRNTLKTHTVYAKTGNSCSSYSRAMSRPSTAVTIETWASTVDTCPQTMLSFS